MTSPSSPRLRGALLALALLGPAARAHAFSDSTTFGMPVAEGGGGGRYFTGAPSDGFTCNVCHAGGKQTSVKITGLPLTGYQPGSSYEITVSWSQALEHVSLALELTDDSGVAAGTLHTPPDKELVDGERCAGTPFAAGQIMPLLNRSVISMPDCGAQRLRFLWSAPADDRGQVRLSGSLVVTDASASVSGDGVTDFARVLPSPSQPTEPATETHGCNVARPGGRGTGGFAAVLLALAAAFRLRRRANT